jgi:hypothetical protein
VLEEGRDFPYFIFLPAGLAEGCIFVSMFAKDSRRIVKQNTSRTTKLELLIN